MARIIIVLILFTCPAQAQVFFDTEPYDCVGCEEVALDVCAERGWYGDGICDPGCADPDPDCDATPPPAEAPEDLCAAEGWYGDGICDEGCLEPDPDCGGAEPEPTPAPTDFCADEGWYGDGICDEGCPQPDPDCEG